MNLVRLQPQGGGSDIEPYIVIVTLEEAFKGQFVTLTQGTETIRGTCPDIAPYEVTFKPMKDGVWTASSTTVDGNVVSKDTDPLTVWGTYNVTLESDFYFVKWLTKGRVTKTFASLHDVLADEDTVRQLMTVHDSVDYMIESIQNDNNFKAKLLASDNALKWIGLRDYTYDNMDTAFISDWLSGNKWEYALKDHVPIMTANNAPYGNASAYQVFDGNASTTASDTDFSYNFVNPICIKKMVSSASGGTLQVSDDGSTWIDDDGGYHLYARCHYSTSTSVNTLQFYGRSLNVSVPNMSDNTTPYGECKASSVVDRQPYKSFSKLSENWYTTKVTNQWLEYDFNKPVYIKAFSVYNVYVMNGNPSIKNYELQYYDKVSNTWEPASKKVLFPSTGTVVLIPTIPSIISDKYRVFVYDSYNKYFIQFNTNFYGVDYTERDFEVESGVLTNRVKYIYDHGVEVVPLTKTETSVLANVDKESKKLLRAKAGYHATNLDKLQRGSGFSTFSVGTEPNNWYLDISSLGGTLSTGFSQVSDTTDIECWME